VIALNINIGGIKNKLISKADWVTFLVSAYKRYDGDLERIFNHYTSFGDTGVLAQVTHSLRNMQSLKYKLWDSPHGYTGLFRAGVYAYLATEFGLLDKKWKKTIEKVLIGSGAAALTLEGSGPIPMHACRRSGDSRGWGQ